jgi:phospho-N-acetylmuramoyl-pentapeptide-transferase
MLYHLFTALIDKVGPFNVFRYPSFRVPAAALTALVITLTLFPRFIELLRRKQYGSSNVREDTPERHKQKSGTPTMGGLFILIAVVGSSLLWADLKNLFVWSVLLVLGGFGAIGFIDDYRKVAKKNSKGLAGKKKIALQLVVLAIVGVVLWAGAGGWLPFHKPLLDTHLTLPFITTRLFHWQMGWLYVPFALIVVLGTSHGLNLTDGLDGLAIGPTIVSSTTFLILAYAAGLVLTFHNGASWVEFNVADYLHIPHVEGVSELAVVCAAIVGASSGFLWYNTFPASIFMGDVGSMALGGALGMMAVFTKNEVLSVIINGIFFVETLSVMGQVASFKLTGKRIFRMAPIHHHFELAGVAEPKIIVRFWIVSIILALVALTSLKLR